MFQLPLELFKGLPDQLPFGVGRPGSPKGEEEEHVEKPEESAEAHSAPTHHAHGLPPPIPYPGIFRLA
jgi:hypothetical protein